MMEGLREPNSGNVVIDDKPVWPKPDATKRLIGVQLQSTALFDYLTVQEMIILFGTFYGLRMSAGDADKFLRTVGLSEKFKAKVNELSGGQQQRLSIALALVNDTMIVFLDEPTTGLDPQARRRMWDVIRDISSQGKTVVLTTHYMEEAEVLCRRVAVMDKGKIISLDTPQNLVKSLGAKAKITFNCEPKLDIETIKGFPGTTDVSEVDQSYVVYTKDVQSSVLGILGEAKERKSLVENLSVSGANLEDVFLHLTGRGLRD